MDSRDFDALTRKLAADGSRRSLIRGLIGGATLFGLGRSGALAKTDKTAICHQTGNGYNVITVANPALPAHYGHGDFAYTDCCTDGECAADYFCDSGACTPLCVDDDCAADHACQNGACAPLNCPPYTAPIDHACQNPCPSWRCTCADGLDGNCMATEAGDAVCHYGSGASFGIDPDCVSDAHCESEAEVPEGYTWVCLHGPADSPISFCYGNLQTCSDWTPV